MKKLLVLFMVLGMASMAQGYQLGLAETSNVDNGDGTATVTLDLTIAMEGAIDIDTMSALAIGASEPGLSAMTAPYAYSAGTATAWGGGFSLAPAPVYPIGAPASAPPYAYDGSDGYDAQMIVDGFDLGGFGAASTDPVLGTITLTAPTGSVIDYKVSAADASSSDYMVYEMPPKYGSLTVTYIPEPGTALFMLLAGALGLIRRR